MGQAFFHTRAISRHCVLPVRFSNNDLLEYTYGPNFLLHEPFLGTVFYMCIFPTMVYLTPKTTQPRTRKTAQRASLFHHLEPKGRLRNGMCVPKGGYDQVRRGTTIHMNIYHEFVWYISSIKQFIGYESMIVTCCRCKMS